MQRNVVLADGTSTVIDLPLAFASASFATVLSQLGSTLKVLILATAVPRPTMSLANLSEVPYDGSLDLALSHCQELETLFMPWQLTSTNFLEALASMERLKQLTLYTIPAPTCDCDRFGKSYYHLCLLVLLKALCLQLSANFQKLSL